MIYPLTCVIRYESFTSYCRSIFMACLILRNYCCKCLKCILGYIYLWLFRPVKIKIPRGRYLISAPRQYRKENSLYGEEKCVIGRIWKLFLRNFCFGLIGGCPKFFHRGKNGTVTVICGLLHGTFLINLQDFFIQLGK